MKFTSATSKGQVVIPADIRKKLGIGEGTKLSVEEQKGRVIFKPVSRDYFESMAGVLKPKKAKSAGKKKRVSAGKGKPS